MVKLNFIASLFLIFFCFILRSELYSKEDSLFIKYVGDTVQVWNTDLTANCASRFSIDLKLSGFNNFTITETDTVGPLANCICNYDLHASLTGLQAGEYSISVYRHELKKYLYPQDTTIFIGELSFTIEDSSTAEQSFYFNQSDCKSYIGEQTFTARFWYTEVVSAAEEIDNDAKIQTIYSDDVLLDGKAAEWTYRFSRYDQINNRPEYLYFHNNISGIVFDSISLYTVCCIMTITDEWFDSDSAIAYADAHGGNAFRAGNPEYMIKSSLVQALVPYSYPSWSITYLSKTDSSKKLSFYFDARENPSLKLSFIPEVDTLYLQGGCSQPGFIFNQGMIGAAENISLRGNDYTSVYIKNSSGIYEPVDNSYFLIEHPDGNYEYELWYYAIAYPRLRPVLISFDSVFYAPQEFYVKLIVKLDETPIDSLSQFFIPQYGLSVNTDKVLPGRYFLFQNHPNPFNPATIINYELPEESYINIAVYNILGEKITELVGSFQKAGKYEIIWNAENFASGIYIYQMITGNFIMTRKLVLLK